MNHCGFDAKWSSAWPRPKGELWNRVPTLNPLSSQEPVYSPVNICGLTVINAVGSRLVNTVLYSYTSVRRLIAEVLARYRFTGEESGNTLVIPERIASYVYPQPLFCYSYHYPELLLLPHLDCFGCKRTCMRQPRIWIAWTGFHSSCWLETMATLFNHYQCYVSRRMGHSFHKETPYRDCRGLRRMNISRFRGFLQMPQIANYCASQANTYHYPNACYSHPYKISDDWELFAATMIKYPFAGSAPLGLGDEVVNCITVRMLPRCPPIPHALYAVRKCLPKPPSTCVWRPSSWWQHPMLCGISCLSFQDQSGSIPVPFWPVSLGHELLLWIGYAMRLEGH